jgi:magnesium chelatase family protein
MTLKAHRDGRAFIVPQASAAEAALVRDAIVYPAASLGAVCGHLSGKVPLERQPDTLAPPAAAEYFDLADVKGQSHAKRALEIAAAGRHSLLIWCPSKP